MIYPNLTTEFVLSSDMARLLTPDQAEKALTWPVMRQQIKNFAEEKEGMRVTRVEIQGVQRKDNGDIFKISTRSLFKTPDDKDGRTLITYSPDSTALYLVFRVAAKEVGTRPQLWLHVIGQSRLNGNLAHSVEPTGGGIDPFETAEQAVVREYREEAGEFSPALQKILQLDKTDLIPLSVAPFPGSSERHYPFLRVVDVSEELWGRVHLEKTGFEAGLAEEFERTISHFMLLEDFSRKTSFTHMQASARECLDILEPEWTCPKVPIAQKRSLPRLDI